MGYGLVTRDVASVQRRFGFDQDDVDLVLGHRQIVNTARDDHEFSGTKPNLAVAQSYQ